jgi:hypothetical protein
MPLICPIPKDDTYDLPEGRYRAVLSSARTLLKSTSRPVQQVRLLFNVNIPSLLNKNPMAGRTFNFDLSRRSELRCFMESWLGADFFSRNTTVDFEQLVGSRADAAGLLQALFNPCRDVLGVGDANVRRLFMGGALLSIQC